jgi:hypothetical protein
MGRLGIAAAAGVALGVASRIEETAEGFSAGISSNRLWILAAFAVGAAARSVAGGAALGVLALTAANAGYYAWVAVTEPGRPLSSVAGPVIDWILVGLAAGVVFGAAGHLWRRGARKWRWMAALALGGVLIADEAGWTGWLLP